MDATVYAIGLVLLILSAVMLGVLTMLWYVGPYLELGDEREDRP